MELRHRYQEGDPFLGTSPKRDLNTLAMRAFGLYAISPRVYKNFTRLLEKLHESGS
jgi:hypothetical protein